MSEQTLEQIRAKWGRTKAVFNLVPQYDDTYKLTATEPYTPPVEGVTDPLELLAIYKFEERFNTDIYRFECSLSDISVYCFVVKCLVKVYSKHIDNKRPSQTKLYKWLENCYEYDNPATRDVFVALFRYAVRNSVGWPNTNFTIHELNFAGGANNPHVKNIIAILERLHGKYKKK